MATNTDHLEFNEQGSAPSTPATGKWRLFTKADGLYIVEDTGDVHGPFPYSSLSNPMTSTGDVIYSSDGSGTPARLAAGSDGEVLTLASGIPSWAAAGGGSSDTWESLMTEFTANLVHRWKFEESSGNFADSINSLTLTPAGSPTYSVSTPLGNGISTTNYAETSGQGSLPTGAAARTIIVVAKLTASASSEYLHSYGAGTARQQFGFQSPSGQLSRVVFFSDNLEWLTSIADGQWHMVAIGVSDSKAAHLYIDGYLYNGVISANAATATSGNFTLGARNYDYSSVAAGTWADLSVFDTWLGRNTLDRYWTVLQALI